MAKEIPITQAMPAHYFRGGGKRPGRGAMAPRRATIGIGGGGKKEGGSEGSSGPASRTIPMGADEQGPPVQETQAPITATGRVPSFAVGNATNGVIDLSSILSAKTNPNYDPTKAIGGENVPFQPTTGIKGYFARVFGNDGNERNLAAQAQQGAEWKQQAAEEARAAREDSRWQKRFDAESGARAKERQLDRDAHKAEVDAALEAKRIKDAQDWVEADQRFEQSQIDTIKARELKEKELKAQQEHYAAMQGLEQQKLTAQQQQANAPHVQTLQDGTTFITQGGKVFRYTPPKLPIGKGENAIPGTIGSVTSVYPDMETSAGAPTSKAGEVQVDPATGRPLGSSLSSTSAPPARAAGFMWPKAGEAAFAPNGVEYRTTKQGLTESLQPTGAFDVPPELQKQLDYPATPEVKQNILKAYYLRKLGERNF